MFKRVFLASAFAGIIGTSAPALGADLDQIIYAPELPVTKPVEIGNGWYLRGDLGYALKLNGAARTYRTFDGTNYGSNNFDTGSLSGNWSGSLGVGYQFTDFLRADATFDYGAESFSGSTSAAAPCLPAYTAGTTCASTDTAKFKNYGLMANAYVDLGTFAKFTPYVGGGVGMTNVRWGGLTNTTRCVNGAGTCDPNTDVPITTVHPGETSWRFTYALMAGVSYDITPSLKVDLGYRYKKIASGGMFGFDSATALAGATGTQAKDNGFSAHEIRAGLRYSLW